MLCSTYFFLLYVYFIKLELVYFLISIYSFAILSALIPIIHNYLCGIAGVWCWIIKIYHDNEQTEYT